MAAPLYPGAPAAVTASAKPSPPAKAQAKPTPTPVSTATQTPFAGYLTPAQQIAQARQEAAIKQAAQVQALARSAAETQQQALANQRTSQLGAQAVAQILQGIAPATSAPYQQAAGADAAFAKGFSTGLSHVQQGLVGEAGNILNLSGGQVQQPEVNAAIGGTNVTDPLYNLGGYIPATTLSREGAAFGAAAANLPAQALGIGQQGAQQARNEAAAAQQKIADQRATLAAGLPALIDASLGRIGSQQLGLARLGTTSPKIFGDSRSGYYTIGANGKVQQLTEPVAATARPGSQRIFGSATSGYYTLDDNGNAVQLTKPAPSAGKPHYYSDAAGNDYVINPDGSIQKLPGQAKVASPTVRSIGNGGLVQVNPNGTVTTLRAPTVPPAKPEDRSIGGGGIVRVNPDGSTRVLRKPRLSASAKRAATYKLPSGADKLAVTMYGGGASGTAAANPILGGLGLGGATATATGPVTPWPEALRRMSAYLRAHGAPRKQIPALAVQVLTANGFEQPGTELPLVNLAPIGQGVNAITGGISQALANAAANLGGK